MISLDTLIGAFLGFIGGCVLTWLSFRFQERGKTYDSKREAVKQLEQFIVALGASAILSNRNSDKLEELREKWVICQSWIDYYYPQDRGFSGFRGTCDLLLEDARQLRLGDDNLQQKVQYNQQQITTEGRRLIKGLLDKISR